MSDSHSRRRVGVIGLGQMGRGIAARLDRAGLLGAAWDIDAGAFGRAGLSAAVAFGPPHDLGRDCDTVLFVVPASPEVGSCLDGPEGLLAAEHPGQILVDLTTSHPAETRRLAARAQAAGRGYLDCGMSGGAAGAESGRLTLMAGGREEDLQRCRPVLDAIAAKIFHMGRPGSGHAMKLVHNLVCHTVFLATAEGCRLAERAGLELGAVLDVLNAGNARSYVSEVRFVKHILSGTFDGRSRVANLAKDLRMAADLAEELDAPAAYGPLSAALLERAAASGLAEQDFTLLYRAIDGLIAAENTHSAAPTTKAPA